MGALLALVPLKDWVYGGLIVALLIGFGWFVHHERAIGSAAELVAVQSASAKAQAEAKKAIDGMNAQHAAEVISIQEKQNADLKAAASNAADLSQRLRNYQASHRCPGSVLSGATAPAAGAVAGAGSVDDAVASLISAAAHDNAVIMAERAERDSLTGK